MRRKIFLAGTLLSLILCAGSICWWVRSGGWMDQFTLQRSGGETYNLLASSGKLLVMHTGATDNSAGMNGQLAWRSVPYVSGGSPGEPALRWTSFSYSSQPSPTRKGAIESTLVLPLWLMTAMCAVVPMVWTKRMFRPAKKQGKH